MRNIVGSIKPNLENKFIKAKDMPFGAILHSGSKFVGLPAIILLTITFPLWFIGILFGVYRKR
jgi:hypothetical protein